MSKNKVAVYIGRFVPYHNGHHSVLTHLLENFEHVILILGSIDAPRNINTPWTFLEREEYISQHLTPEQLYRTTITGIRDTLYQTNRWVKEVYSLVYDTCERDFVDYENCDIHIVGSSGRDASEEYANMFRSWKFYDVKEISNSNINATDIRLEFFGCSPHQFQKSPLSKNIDKRMLDWLDIFIDTEPEAMNRLMADYDYLVEEQLTCNSIKYGQNYYTADAVVTQSGHILLIQRNSEYGDKQWALPGGHVNKSETSEEASIRELKEETNINLQESVLKKSIAGKEIFEEPERSPRGRLGKHKTGRTVTVAYHFALSDEHPLPKVKGASDAGKAWWFDFAEVENMKDQLFEDHYDIIEHFLHK